MANSPEVTNMAAVLRLRERRARRARRQVRASSTSARCSSGCCSRAASSSRRPTATGSATRRSRRAMHEAAFELIEIPHVRQSGKNSADIRMVVDALDLCYTKSHVDTFVVISGDSDFSPLVSQAAREQQDRDRRRREELDVRPADRLLRRVHLLRRPRARAASARSPPHASHAPRRAGGRTVRLPPKKTRRGAASRKRSTSCSTRSRRSCASAAATRRSGARWSSRR